MESFRGRAPVLGVFGGTFDPPHMGHVLLPIYLRARALVDRLVVAPCADHPLGKSMSPFPLRLAWTRAAMATLGASVEVSDIEARLAAREGGPSFTLRLLEAIAAANPDAQVRLVVGSDIVQTGQTDRWHRWDRIVECFEPIVVPRAGYGEAQAAMLPQVSSTQVRQHLASGTTADRAALTELVPAAVLEAIERARRAAPPVWLVGRGHVWTHVEPWLRGRGWSVRSFGARASLPAAIDGSEAEPAVVWLLVGDTALAGVASALRGRLPAGTPVLHAAGALPSHHSQALGALAAAGHPVGTLHPICSLRAERSWPSHLHQATFGIEGDPAARQAARSLVGEQAWLDLETLGERERRAYHAACALVANHLAVLEQTSADVLRAQGHPPERVEAALGVLLRSALGNLLALGIPRGISGPVARGDLETVRGHLDALEPEARALYEMLSGRLEHLVAASS